jgi:hypothetical protein
MLERTAKRAKAELRIEKLLAEHLVLTRPTSYGGCRMSRYHVSKTK